MKRRDFLKLNIVAVGALVIPPIAVADTVEGTKWGKRFFNKKNEATSLESLNDRRLLIKIKKDMEDGLLFNIVLYEFNDDYTRTSVLQMMSEYFNKMVENDSIKEYEVVCDLSNNPPALVDANKFRMDMTIKSGFTNRIYQIDATVVPASAEFAGMV